MISCNRAAGTSGVNFEFGPIRTAVIRRPIAGQLPHRRLLDHALAGFFRGVEFGLELLDIRLRVKANVLGVDLVEHRMVFDLAIQNRLSDGGVVDFRVTVPPEADEIDHNVGPKLVAIFQSHAAGAHHRIRIFAINVENGNRQPLGKIGGEPAGIGIAGIGSEADEIVDDDVYGSANVVAAQVGQIQRLGGDSLSGKSGIAMHEHR